MRWVWSAGNAAWAQGWPGTHALPSVCRCDELCPRMMPPRQSARLAIYGGNVMPETLEHVDAIARRMKRNVPYLDFLKAKRPHRADYQRLESRSSIAQWLGREGIGWRERRPFTSTTVKRSHASAIFIDVPFDESDAQYRKVRSFHVYPGKSWAASVASWTYFRRSRRPWRERGDPQHFTAKKPAYAPAFSRPSAAVHREQNFSHYHRFPIRHNVSK